VKRYLTGILVGCGLSALGGNACLWVTGGSHPPPTPDAEVRMLRRIVYDPHTGQTRETRLQTTVYPPIPQVQPDPDPADLIPAPAVPFPVPGPVPTKGVTE
jgi:hypothetical protein